MLRESLLTVAILAATPPAGAIEFGLPADCGLGETCFFQQFADMEPGPDAADPFCGPAAYDGHDGTDLRVLSMADVDRGVPVAAMADGVVLRTRDGEPDRLVVTEEDRAAVASKECGNGVVLSHEGGFETQYCHMRQGSIAVRPGDRIEGGDKLGEVGASGLAQFPHVHVAVRRGGEPVDPVTGRALAQGCLADPAEHAPLFAPGVMAFIDQDAAALLASGLAGAPLDHAALAVSGPPKPATAASPNLVGWAWFINLRQGDRLLIRLAGPDGGVLVENLSEPLDRDKASQSVFAGRRGAPSPGAYRLSVGVLRAGELVLEESRTIELR